MKKVPLINKKYAFMLHKIFKDFFVINVQAVKINAIRGFDISHRTYIFSDSLMKNSSVLNLGGG